MSNSTTSPTASVGRVTDAVYRPVSTLATVTEAALSTPLTMSVPAGVPVALVAAPVVKDDVTNSTTIAWALLTLMGRLLELQVNQ